MKKYIVYIIVLICGISVFFLQFGYNKRHGPSTFYQVYLDDETIGVIKSKEEFEEYIQQQGNVIREQVEQYNVNINSIKTVKDIMKKVILKNNQYYDIYQNTINVEDIYNKINDIVDSDGNLDGSYESLENLYNSLDNEYKNGSLLTDKGIKEFEKLKNNIDNDIKSKESKIIDYLYTNRNSLDLTSSEYSQLEEFVNNKLIDISYSKYVDMTNFVENNKIYLSVEDIYEPLGINIRKIVTYNKNYMDVSDVYNKIVEEKPCSIEGYQFRIKRSNSFELSPNTLLGASANNDYEVISNNLNEDITVYVTDPSIFNDAIEELTTVFVGKKDYEDYKDNKQKEIVNTGTRIENIYLKEDITMKETNISVKEKIYNDSSSLASYLLYGDKVQTNTVYASADDTISGLAYKNGISVEEFFLSNPSFTGINNIFYDGQPIILTKLNPRVSIVVEESQVEDKNVAFKTIEKYDNTMTKGIEKVEQNGSNGLMRVSQNVKKINGSISSINLVSNETIKNSKDKIVLVGTKEIPNVGSTTSWGWPTNSGYTLTSYFGWRAYPFSPARRELHAGLDIAGTGYGSPIYASNNGTIESIKSENWNYGNSIIINHNNGYWTNYGHMSRFAPGLKVGQTVSRGQIIGYMGHTGAATGTHLHFEIRVGSNRYANVTDPLPFLQK